MERARDRGFAVEIDAYGNQFMRRSAATDAPAVASGSHSRMIGRPGRIGALARFLDHAAAHPRVVTAAARRPR